MVPRTTGLGHTDKDRALAAGDQDKTGCNGGAQGHGAERLPRLPCLWLPLRGTAQGTEQRWVRGLSPVLLISACSHIFSLTILNAHFACYPFSLFSFTLSRQQSTKNPAPRRAERSRVGGTDRGWPLGGH